MRRQNKKQTTCVTSTDQRKYISIAEGDCETRNQNFKKKNAFYSASLFISTMKSQVQEPLLNFKNDKTEILKLGQNESCNEEI